MHSKVNPHIAALPDLPLPRLLSSNTFVQEKRWILKTGIFNAYFPDTLVCMGIAEDLGNLVTVALLCSGLKLACLQLPVPLAETPWAQDVATLVLMAVMVAGLQAPIKATLSLPFARGQGTESIKKRFMS